MLIAFRLMDILIQISKGEEGITTEHLYIMMQLEFTQIGEQQDTHELLSFL